MDLVTRPVGVALGAHRVSGLDRRVDCRRRDRNVAVRLVDTAPRGFWSKCSSWPAVAGVSAGPRLRKAHAQFRRALLAPTRKELDHGSAMPDESRFQVVDASAAELRRIERDLHDGAQARLVSLGMSIGLAEQVLGAIPTWR